MKKFLVTSALPYANGRLHIGHIAGAYLPADIFVRFQRLQGNDVIYICGTDEHGAPISIRAEAEGVTPREIVNRYHQSIRDSFEGLHFCMDNFSGTAREHHVELSQKFFLNLLERGYINTRTNRQFFCEHDRRFLADRYVEGTCPYCGYDGARGDQCDNCGKLMDASNLKEPKCKICGNTPVLKETRHWYLDLPKFEPKLRAWLETRTNWKDNVHKFILSWLDEGLIERSITRDTDWGVPVPLEDAEGKVLYVWFDAPIGYISSTVEWAGRIGEPDRWKDYWLDPDTRLIHFLGKDNIPFHTIIWPAMLMEQEQPYVLPFNVPANEYLNLEGKKISTSRNWAVWVEDYLKHFDGELLRYVLAVNAPETKDSDFSWTDFQAHVNNELANILGNLLNRLLHFSLRNFEGVLHRPEQLPDSAKDTLAMVDRLVDEAAASYDSYRVRKAVTLIMDIARLGNRFFDESQPWKTVKTDPKATEATLWTCAELLRKLSIAFSPILPHKMESLRATLGLKPVEGWHQIAESREVFQLTKSDPLFPRIEDKRIQEQIRILEEQSSPPPPEIEHKSEIEYEDFAKLEIRVVKVLEAEKVKKSNKLLKLKVVCGSEIRSVVAGIAGSYKPEQLVGQSVVMLINLKPRKLMGHLSQGMLLAAEHDGNLSLLVPQREIPDGSPVS